MSKKYRVIATPATYNKDGSDWFSAVPGTAIFVFALYSHGRAIDPDAPPVPPPVGLGTIDARRDRGARRNRLAHTTIPTRRNAGRTGRAVPAHLVDRRGM